MAIFFGVLALVLIALIIFQIARTRELVNVLKNEDEFSSSTNTFNAVAVLVMGILGLIGIVWSVISYKDKFLPEAASMHGIWIDNMIMVTLFFTGIVFLVTHILLFWFAYKYRYRRDRSAYYYPQNNKLEVVWTVVPAIVLTILVVMGINYWMKITGPAPDDAMVVEVTGQQFNWTARYPGQDGELGDTKFELIDGTNKLGMDWDDEATRDDILPNKIHLIKDQPVLFKLRAKDVLHSFFLPHFRVKMDCVPGTPTRFWMKPTKTTEEMRKMTGNEGFTYELACAELCGQGHYNMRMEVVVHTREEFNKWKQEQQPYYEVIGANEEAESSGQEQALSSGKGGKEEESESTEI